MQRSAILCGTVRQPQTPGQTSEAGLLNHYLHVLTMVVRRSFLP